MSASRDNDATQIKLRELESVAKSYRGLYDGLIHRHSEAIVQQEQPSTSARYLTRAYPPMSRNMKKPLMLAAMLAPAQRAWALLSFFCAT